MNKGSKENSLARPVVSVIGAPQYKLAKFLDSVIKPFIPDKYILRSSTDFKEKLYQFKFKSNQIPISFDVNSLSIKISLNENVNLIAAKIYLKTVDEA